MRMTPFMLTLNFTTPVSAGALPTLDAVLAAEIARERGDDAIDDLPLRETEKVWHASSLFTDRLGFAISHTKVAMRGKDRLEVPERVQRVKGKYRKWPNLLNRYDLQAASVGVYLGVGDLNSVEAIFRDIPAIGVRRADGMGLIDSFIVEPVEVDAKTWGLKDGAGRPVRPVPVDIWREFGAEEPEIIEVCRWRPFYWQASNPTAICAVPPSTSIAELVLEN